MTNHFQICLIMTLWNSKLGCSKAASLFQFMIINRISYSFWWQLKSFSFLFSSLHIIKLSWTISHLCFNVFCRHKSILFLKCFQFWCKEKTNSWLVSWIEGDFSNCLSIICRDRLVKWEKKIWTFCEQ